MFRTLRSCKQVTLAGWKITTMFDGTYLGKMGIFMGLWAHVRFREGRFDTFPKPKKKTLRALEAFPEKDERSSHKAHRVRETKDDESGGYVGQGNPLNSGAFSDNGKLGGGFKHFLCSPLFGEDFQI